MVVQTITTEFGHAVPPEGPHTITVHAPRWETSMRIRDGDMTLFAKVVSMYPRFAPFSVARTLSTAIGKKLQVPGMTSVLMFTDPDVFTAQLDFSTSEHRKQDKVAAGDLSFKVVDIRGVRLYCVVFPVLKTRGIIGGLWQNAGLGISTRTAEELLRYVDDLKVVEWSGDVNNVPAATYLPECEAHGKLRERITDLLHRAPLDPEKVKVAPDDVYLYQTGMAAIYRLNAALIERNPGTIVVLGAVFHNTWHLFDEAPGGMKHFGPCGADSGVMDKLEEYLEAEEKEGRTISYVFVEFPSNPILVSVDLKRLRLLADKYAFPLVIDDTVGSYSNLDVLPVADLLISSNTKSFSGYADVMSGTVVLNPLSPLYPEIKHMFRSHFRNEFFSGDAEKLLANSQDYLGRTAVLNRNAAALATYLQTRAADPDSPVTDVLYPAQSDTRANYEAFMRRPAEELAPGYGCLLSVDFDTLDAAVAFYDNLAFFHGPHLGAHRSLALPFNATVYGRDPVEAKYHASYGLRPQQVRLSVGLEAEEDLLDTVKAALEKAEEAFRGKAVGGVKADEVIDNAKEAVTSKEEAKSAAEGVKANYEG